MLYERYPRLAECKEDIVKAVSRLFECFERGGKLLICGNGGGSADADHHIVGELMKGFLKNRPLDEKKKEKLQKAGLDGARISSLQGALPAISLSSQTALLSAYANDADPDLVYAQEVIGYGKPGDVLLCISTSGNSKNVVFAAKTASALGLTTVALTGKNESELSKICSVAVRVPETETYKVQELHLPVYHYICERIEAKIFGN